MPQDSAEQRLAAKNAAILLSTVRFNSAYTQPRRMLTILKWALVAAQALGFLLSLFATSQTQQILGQFNVTTTSGAATAIAHLTNLVSTAVMIFATFVAETILQAVLDISDNAIRSYPRPADADQQAEL